MTFPRSLPRTVATALAILLLFTACSSDTEEVISTEPGAADDLVGILSGTTWNVVTIDGEAVTNVTVSFFRSDGDDGGDILSVNHTDSCSAGSADLEPSTDTFIVRSSASGTTADCTPNGSLEELFTLGETVTIEQRGEQLELRTDDSTAVADHFVSQSVQVG